MRYYILLVSIWTIAETATAQDLASIKSLAYTKPERTAATTTIPQRAKGVASPIYVKLYGFYGLLTPGSQITTSTTSSPVSTNTSFKTNSTGLGAGPRAGIGIGLVASDFVNVGIDADILFGSNLTTNNTYIGSNYTYTNTSSVMLKLLSVTPNITFKALSRPAYYIYNRLGFSVAKVMEYKTIQHYQSIPNSGPATIGESRNEFTKNGLSFGYQAALGIQVRLSDKLRGFVEVVAINQSFQPAESTITSTATKSGVTTQNQYTNLYKKQGEYLTVTNDDGSNIYQQPTTTIAVNSLGIGVGLLLRL